MKSMTAMGRATGKIADLDAVLELKSVNSKHRDLSCRLPRGFACIEEKIAAAVEAAGILRGKIDLTLTLQSKSAPALAPDRAAIAERVAMLRALAAEFSLADDIGVMAIAAAGELFRGAEETVDPDELFATLSPLLTAALADFTARREAEGARLLADMREKLAYIGACVEKIKILSAETVKNHRAALTARMREILAELEQTPDEGRLLTEAALFADRIAIDEELVRLSSHLLSFTEIAAEAGAGRKLDFLLQEMNREANTLGAKCADAAVALQVVEIKATLEKIREQVQNIE